MTEDSGGPGPYRTADTDACPTCKGPLPFPNTDRTKPRACPAHCGEWWDATTVERRWGDAVDIEGDQRLLWRHTSEKLLCIVCDQPMRRVVNSAWVAHRCRDHGVWFVKQGRTHFERVQADDIKHHLALLAKADNLSATLHDIVAKDPRATRALAMRIIKLEDTVERQRQSIAQLFERLRALE